MAKKTVKKPKIWTDKVCRAWELPEKLTVSQWADRARVLDASNAEPGPWHTQRTPYLKGIMDAFNNSLVEDITIMASTQCGKTESMLNMVGFAIDQDPAPMLVVMPREEDARSISSRRIIPMIFLSPSLRSHITSNSDDITKMEISLDRMTIFMSGANSPAGLAQRPIRYLFLDETDKYPRFSEGEADPIKLASERTRTFWNRKIVKCSTPTTKEGYIFREYERSDMRKYFVPCPSCGKEQVLVWTQVKWPKEIRDPEEVKNKRLAWYECVACKAKIEDGMKQKMLLNGRWIAEGGDSKVSRSKVGFWINAMYSPWLSFSEIAAEWLNSYEKPELLMNFINSWLAEPWEENFGRSNPQELAKHALNYRAGEVPGDVIVLTGGVDIQKDHFYFTIRGWGYGQESWQILSARVETWEEVIHYMFKAHYPSEIKGIEPFQVRLVGFDTGYRADEVYELCREWSDVARPIKGQRSIGIGVPLRASTIDKFPGNGQAIPGGLKLWTLDTTYFKDKITRLVRNTKQDTPGGWHLHSKPSDEYLKQFCSEHKVITRDKKGRATEAWVPVFRHGATHFWDCEVYATAMAEMLRHLFTMRPDDKRHIYPVEGELDQSSKSPWIPKRTGWIKHG